MYLILSRKEFREDGIFGELTDARGNLIAVTLERSYFESPTGKYISKMDNGNYQCVKGSHRLAGMDKDFTTFEITGVEYHDGMLFHVGNYNEDSEGCVLLGKGMGWKSNGGKMIVNSKVAFDNFMKLMQYIDSFYLQVE